MSDHVSRGMFIGLGGRAFNVALIREARFVKQGSERWVDLVYADGKTEVLRGEEGDQFRVYFRSTLVAGNVEFEEAPPFSADSIHAPNDPMWDANA